MVKVLQKVSGNKMKFIGLGLMTVGMFGATLLSTNIRAHADYDNIPNKVVVKVYEDVPDFTGVKTTLYEVKQDDSGVKTEEIGSYRTKVKMEGLGVNLTKKVSVQVVDEEKPTIEYLGKGEYSVKKDIKWEDEFKFSDNYGIDEDSFKIDGVDVNKLGKQEGVVKITDKAKNESSLKVQVNIVDKEAPKISGEDLSTMVDEEIDLTEGLKLEDNYSSSDELTKALNVDTSLVNLSEAGTYEVKYKVKDSSGNEATFSRNLVVEAPVVEEPVVEAVVEDSIDDSSNYGSNEDYSSGIVEEANNVVEQTPAPAPAPAPEPEPEPEVVQPVARTDGFNFNGYHFDVAWFSGSGQVPANSLVYRWADAPSHYLFERMGVPGSVVRSIGIGTKVVIDGATYTVYNMSTVSRDSNAYDVINSGASVTWQTCDSNGTTLTIWYAR